MKAHQGILICLLAMMMCACDATTHEARRMVRRAEHLADTLPDSTVRLIDSVLRMPVNFSERERMDMALMQAEVLFGDRRQEIAPVMDDDFFDDRGPVSTSPELERAADYYAKKKEYAKAAHAALYNGFVQQHYDEKEAAMRSFKEAEQYGMIASDSLTVARAEYWMGKMLYDDYMEQDALDLLKNSELFFSNAFAERSLAENLMAACHLVIGDYKNADICLKNSLFYAEKGHFNKAKRKTMNNYAVLYQLQGDYEKAINYLLQVEADADSSNMILLYLNLGNIYLVSGQSDTAKHYFDLLEEMLPNTNIKKVETRVSAYAALSHFTELQGDNAKALQYLKEYENNASTILASREQKSIYRIQKQFDYESLQNEMNEKIISRHRIIIIISALLLIAAIVIMALQHKQKRLMEAEAELKIQIDAMKQDLRQTVKSSVMEKEVALRLRMMFTANHVKKKAKDPNNEWGALVWQVMNGKDNLFEAAQATIETVYPDLYSVITERHPDLTKTEARLCLLSFTDLSNAEMAEILGLRLNTINQNRSNLRKKLNLNSDKLKDQMRDELS